MILALHPDQIFGHMVSKFQGVHAEPIIKQQSRNGEVLRIPHPVMVKYANPLDRVLFNPHRDCNHFFHLFEAMWMLAGRNDLLPLHYFVSTFSQFSDDGITLNGAYGYRWRHALEMDTVYDTGEPQYKYTYDQLDAIIHELRDNPDSRRCVLLMWNVMDDLKKIRSSVDTCCNTHAYFLLTDGKLDMTVCNRSNDMVLGMLGANLVHFSFLQEYIANCVGVPVGNYYQITNNLHVYSWNWDPEYWLAGRSKAPLFYPTFERIPLVQDKGRFDEEVKIITDFPEATKLNDPVDLEQCPVKEPFLAKVVHPANVAFMYHKERQYDKSLSWVDKIDQLDWRIACRQWVKKRRDNWRDKIQKESTNAE